MGLCPQQLLWQQVMGVECCGVAWGVLHAHEQQWSLRYQRGSPLHSLLALWVAGLFPSLASLRLFIYGIHAYVCIV